MIAVKGVLIDSSGHSPAIALVAEAVNVVHRLVVTDVCSYTCSEPGLYVGSKFCQPQNIPIEALKHLDSCAIKPVQTCNYMYTYYTHVC